MKNVQIGDATTLGHLRRLLKPFADDMPISTHSTRFTVLTFKGSFPDYFISIVGNDEGAPARMREDTNYLLYEVVKTSGDDTYAVINTVTKEVMSTHQTSGHAQSVAYKQNKDWLDQ